MGIYQDTSKTWAYPDLEHGLDIDIISYNRNSRTDLMTDADDDLDLDDIMKSFFMQASGTDDEPPKESAMSGVGGDGAADHVGSENAARDASGVGKKQQHANSTNGRMEHKQKWKNQWKQKRHTQMWFNQPHYPGNYQQQQMWTNQMQFNHQQWNHHHWKQQHFNQQQWYHQQMMGGGPGWTGWHHPQQMPNNTMESQMRYPYAANAGYQQRQHPAQLPAGGPPYHHQQQQYHRMQPHQHRSDHPNGIYDGAPQMGGHRSKAHRNHMNGGPRNHF